MPLIKASQGPVVVPSGSFQQDPVVVEAKLAEARVTPVYTGRRPMDDDKMSKSDWAAKDQRISRQGLYQAALQSTAIMQYAMDIPAYLKLVRQVAEDGLKFVSGE